MECGLLVMQPSGLGITSQLEYERLILNQNSKTNSKLTCLKYIIIVRQSLGMTTDSLNVFCTVSLGTLRILALYKFYTLFILYY